MKQAKMLILVAIVAIISGCASSSFDERWATGMALNTGIRAASTQALNEKKISVTEAKQILTMNDQARAILDEAEKHRKTDLKTAEGKLTLAESVIQAIRRFFAGRQVQVPVPKSTTRKEK